MSRLIRTTINPSVLTLVSEESYLDLLRQGAVFGDSMTPPPDPDDVEVAGFLDNETSQTYARLLAQLAAVVDAGTGVLPDALRAAFALDQGALPTDNKIASFAADGTVTRGAFDALYPALRWFDVKLRGAKGNGKAVTDAAITAGQTTLSSATAAFTSADVGKAILVHGAGASGAALSTTISSVSAGVATLAATAGTTVSAGRAVFGTDDTAAIQAAINAAAAAGGGTVYFPRGVYVVAGALQDPTGANAQISLPSVDVLAAKQITIVLRGDRPAPPVASVVGFLPVPDQHTVITSFLTAGTGGNCIGGIGPAGSFGGFTSVTAVLRDLTVRMPPNTTHTAVDLHRMTAAEADGVMIDAGSYDVKNLALVTTTTSYGIRFPALNNGAYTRIGTLGAVGYYTGFQFSEHTVAQQVTVMGCYQGVEFAASGHASLINRLLVQHVTRPVVFTSTHYVDIGQLDIEHSDGTGAAWMVTDFDVYDPTNRGFGNIRWHSALANFGIHNVFNVSGGANLYTYRVGQPPEDRVAVWAQSFYSPAAGPAMSVIGAAPAWSMPNAGNPLLRASILLPRAFLGKKVTVKGVFANPTAATGDMELFALWQQGADGSDLTAGTQSKTIVATALGQNIVQTIEFPVTGTVTVTDRRWHLMFQRHGDAVPDTLTGAVGFLGLEIVRA